jgi:phosphotransferase family enzyme
MPATPAADPVPGWLDQVTEYVTAAIGSGRWYGEPLRRWGSSEVWRIRAESGASVIVKRGRHAMAREADVYADLVRPMGLPAPELLGSIKDRDAVVLVLRDVGADTLEQRPSLAGCRQAVRLLAGLRTRAAAAISGGFLVRHRRGPDSFVAAVPVIADGLRRLRPDLPEIPAGLERIVAEAMAWLHANVPETVVHGDFEGKNLVIDGREMWLIDWPTACVSPHLADLYSLWRTVKSQGINRNDLLSWYAADVASEFLQREFDIGGLCWTLDALRWIVEEGVRTVPDSIRWLDDLLAELHTVSAPLISGEIR